MTKTYLSSYLCDSSDRSDISDSNDSSNSSEGVTVVTKFFFNQKTLYTKKNPSGTSFIHQKKNICCQLTFLPKTCCTKILYEIKNKIKKFTEKIVCKIVFQYQKKLTTFFTELAPLSLFSS